MTINWNKTQPIGHSDFVYSLQLDSIILSVKHLNWRSSDLKLELSQDYQVMDGLPILFLSSFSFPRPSSSSTFIS